MHGVRKLPAYVRRDGLERMDLNQVTVTAADLGRAERFYRLLGLRLIVRADHYLRFECRLDHWCPMYVMNQAGAR